jgi:3' exoribonuclease, RNase T-like
VKYWIDTEFIERPYTIDLISVGLVAEDGREFYAESSEVDWSKANQWTLENVRPQLEGKGLKRVEIGYAIRQFTDGDEHPCRGTASHGSQEPRGGLRPEPALQSCRSSHASTAPAAGR